MYTWSSNLLVKFISCRYSSVGKSKEGQRGPAVSSVASGCAVTATLFLPPVGSGTRTCGVGVVYGADEVMHERSVRMAATQGQQQAAARGGPAGRGTARVRRLVFVPVPVALEPLKADRFLPGRYVGRTPLPAARSTWCT